MSFCRDARARGLAAWSFSKNKLLTAALQRLQIHSFYADETTPSLFFPTLAFVNETRQFSPLVSILLGSPAQVSLVNLGSGSLPTS